MTADTDMRTQIWQRLIAAADDREDPMRLHTLATVDASGAPDARLMLLRGATAGDETLWFHTDVRSVKVDQLMNTHRVCSVCYDPRDAVQLRLYGGVGVHCDDEVAHRHWEQMDVAVRYAYAAELDDTAAIPDLRMRDHAARLQTDDADGGRAHLAVLEMRVDTIEWLRVRSTERDERVTLRPENETQEAMP